MDLTAVKQTEAERGRLDRVTEWQREDRSALTVLLAAQKWQSGAVRWSVASSRGAVKSWRAVWKTSLQRCGLVDFRGQNMAYIQVGPVGYPSRQHYPGSSELTSWRLREWGSERKEATRKERNADHHDQNNTLQPKWNTSIHTKRSDFCSARTKHSLPLKCGFQTSS